MAVYGPRRGRGPRRRKLIDLALSTNDLLFGMLERDRIANLNRGFCSSCLLEPAI